MGPLLRAAVSDSGSGAPAGQSPAPPADGSSSTSAENPLHRIVHLSSKENT
jgi:hypothetical protein